jgi:putative PIN family toxin of toxin-antitoxin system
MERIVFDTNVLVSSLIATGPPSQVMDMVYDRMHLTCISSRILEEYRTVVAREKFRRYPAFVEAAANALARIRYVSDVVEPKRFFRVCTDPKDDKFLDVAYAASAKYLITGNKRDFPPHSFRGIRIVSPYEFLALVK